MYLCRSEAVEEWRIAVCIRGAAWIYTVGRLITCISGMYKLYMCVYLYVRMYTKYSCVNGMYVCTYVVCSGMWYVCIRVLLYVCVYILWHVVTVRTFVCLYMSYICTRSC